MDRVIIYPGAIPQDSDLLYTERFTEIALGFMMRAAFGTSTIVDGLAVTQQSSPNMSVQVGQGAIITQTVVDPTGVGLGSIPADTTTNLVKIGINTQPTNMAALTAPTTSGQSQNWLIEAQFLEHDGSPTVLPYYNASNPTVPYTGPSNTGSSQNTRRFNNVQLQWKAGTAAATGSQVTPSPDSGWIGVAVVTVANGQSAITNANITPYVGGTGYNFVPTKLPFLRQKLTSNLTLYVSATGSDNNSGLSSSVPFATLQQAWNTIVNNYDLNGYGVTVSVGNGSYTSGLVANGVVTGLGSGNGVTFLGNTTTPSNVTITTSNAHCIAATGGAYISVGGMTLSASGTAGGSSACGVLASNGATVNIINPMVFGTCTGSHLGANASASISMFGGTYTITGNAANHALATTGAFINVLSCVVTLTGTPAFTTFATAAYPSTVQFTNTTFTGSATGARYSATLNGVVITNGGGANYFPGSTAGSTTAGGQYT